MCAVYAKAKLGFLDTSRQGMESKTKVEKARKVGSYINST